ncbi:phage portal protein [Plesiomonas shigelloides]|uniref:phage portal protein n=1 Tax=Plesiomonas shigelloides TaxID=703 RepID=UPI001261A22A|nr:phage portal protein [Plesiomonas shigelloides]KAB7672847.1 phage portal protein [Plesiomonas shigelloides]
MTKHRRHRSNKPSAPAEMKSDTAKAEVFTFGDPVPVLSQREVFDYLEAMHNGRWYEPPLSLNGLSRVYRAGVHHSSAIQVKRNILRSCFIAHPLLSTRDFTGLALDYLIFGNCYLQQVKNRLGGVMRYDHMRAKHTRRGVNLDSYWWVAKYGQETELAPGSVGHAMEIDINQEIYGIPDYVGGLNSILLNESATLFRRRYYENGSHAGFILYMTDPAAKEEDIENLKTALRNSKGPGNFRNLLMYAPNGKKDGLQLMPVAEVAAKDEFLSIKNVSRDDQLSTHRVPPQLMGVMPNNTGGFGDVTKAARVFDVNEIDTLKASLLELNEWAGDEIIRFNPYRLAEATEQVASGSLPQI